MDLKKFQNTNLFDAATNLFEQLRIKLNSNTAEPLPTKDILKGHYKDNDTFKAIDQTFFLGIIDDSVFKPSSNKYTAQQAIEQGDQNYNGLMLFALELTKQPSRTEISELTRAFNRISHKMPVALVFKYIIDNEAVISIAISERFKYLQNWRQGEKAGKVMILRDIYTQNTHAGHIRILLDLQKHNAQNFNELHQHWLQVLDVSILNKKFYQELANWYFVAMNEVSFPDDLEKKKEVRNATNLIRLITRIIFIWFLKEKQLIPASLFQKDSVAGIVKDFNKTKESHNYYNAILQNLFFGTLNQKMGERRFAKDADFANNKQEYGVKNLFRYADLFTIPENKVLDLFKDVPFLNGGLFDCLDKPNDEGKIEYVDGFSRNAKKQAIVPDDIFFSEEKEVNLNEEYGTKNKRYSYKGLINLLESYKFTIAENTPIEEEIALDPELLGKVFENLLASYNPETQTTARKQTGSFYTPREIVNYMVDESLLEYIKQNVKNDSKDFETRLRDVFSYSENPNPFNEAETNDLIEAINNCKILDPACGSGAFPMGVLHKMVHLLQKLDPGNVKWKAQQKEKIIGNQIKELEKDRKAIEGLSDKAVREKAIKAVDERLKEIDEIFQSKNNFDDYARKLYLIENSIYGIDIQPIAVQIAKLRFFISLIIDQEKDSTKENLGFRSLPNLETKFVAANTLIGLEKPNLVTGDIFIQDTLNLIKEKSDQLKEIRHNYFNAKLRKDKLQFQSEDKKLRKEISQLLVKIGYTKGNAYNIASFDPYDQNHFAYWFEPEWMFGNEVKDGFDIVIGNPPYGATYSEAEKRYFKDNYQSAKTIPNKQKGSLDTFTLFIEQGFNSLKKNGCLTFIVPIAITSSDSMTGIHNLLESNCEEIRISSYAVRPQPVFQNAVVNTSIIFFTKTETNCKRILATKMYRKNNDINLEKLVNNLEFIDVYNYRLIGRYPKISYDIERKILDKIFSQKISIGQLQKPTGINIFYRFAGGRYFKVITNYSTGSSAERTIGFDKKIANSIGAILI